VDAHLLADLVMLQDQEFSGPIEAVGDEHGRPG
jgi:hypothetical protein